MRTQSSPNTLIHWGLPVLSGVLMATSYIPYPPWALLFGFAPLLWHLHLLRNNWKQAFFSGWLCQFTFSLIGFRWIAHTAAEFGQLPPVASYLVLLLFAATVHLYFAVSASLWVFLKKKWGLSGFPALLLYVLLFCFFERLNPTLFFWHFGYTWLYAQAPGMHLAPWIGFYGLHIVTLFVNVLLFGAVYFRKWLWVAPAMGLLLVTNVAGHLSKKQTLDSETLQVLIVQANIGNSIKLAQEKGYYFDDYILNKHITLTNKGLKENPGTQLILWPETAYPKTVRTKRKSQLQKRLEYYIQETNIPVLTGAYELGADRKTYNSLVAFSGQGEMIDSYRKTYLLAFGEYMPGREIYPPIKKMFPAVADFGRGTGEKVMSLNGILYGAQICYESLFAPFTSKLQSLGSQIIVNITNDSWFGTTLEPYQHLYITLARAMEHRRSLLRSTNTGISTSINTLGEMSEFSPMQKEWVGAMTVDYSLTPEPTFYAKLSSYWIYIFSVLIVLLRLYAQTRMRARVSRRR